MVTYDERYRLVVGPDPRCEECGCSIVERFGDGVGELCASCEDDIARHQEAMFWGQEAA